jgi:glycosyltransferase involved in cell wall biosynthesis
MKRVIYAWNYVEWGGSQIHFLALLREARKEFETVIVLPSATDTQFLGFLRSEGIRFETFEGSIDLKPKQGIIEKLRRHWTETLANFAMLRKIVEVGIDDEIVHTDIAPSQSLLTLMRLCLRSNVFVTLHNAMPTVSKWRWILWKFKYRVISFFHNFHVFCTNRHAADYFALLFSNRVNRETKLTYDSINPEEIDRARSLDFDRGAILDRFQIPPNKFIVLTVGQFIDRKGRWTVLEAAKTIASHSDEIVFIWVSPFLADEVDAAKILSFELGDKFSLIRSDEIGANRLDILQFFRIADAFVLPSYVEGVPIALLEAMTLGIPCVSTNVYGIPEAIIHEKSGLLIEPGDGEALAKCVLRLYSDPDLRLRLANSGRSHALANFDERVAARTAVRAYKAVLGLEK